MKRQNIVVCLKSVSTANPVSIQFSENNYLLLDNTRDTIAEIAKETAILRLL